ncbi:LPS assembly protein LptD [Gammaproteobacteria bacterium]|nr:LPS assembly protein LptD [Gammaproteobacteria bacterium]MDC1075031.1 LPS assembly protein LptD [Gammaproteobacteria bacterium]MDC6460407.1 LPS assembly protein LptD [Gammaproteobacteria bacterium]
MKKFNYVAPILLGASLFVHANEEFLVDGVLVPTAQSNTQSCISYFPVMGLVKEMEDLKVNSEKFKFTDDKKLILDGKVELDFPEGLLRAQSAELDRENGKIKFSNNGEIFLEDFYFNANGGYLNKDDKSISLSKGMAFSNERSLIFNFLELYGQLDQKIYLKNTSMTSCANPDQGWALQAKEIILNSEEKRGLAKNVKIKAANKTIFALPYLPFATSDERMSGFLEPSISYSSDGMDMMIPYYRVISKKSDITIAPRYIAKRGPGIEMNYRSLHGNDNNFRNVDLIYFSNDDEFKDEFFDEETSRWIYKYTDKFSYGSSSINIDWSKSSDGLVLRDIPGEITSIGYQRIQNLNQNFSLNTQFNNSFLTIEHQGFQSLNPILSNGYVKSPSIDYMFLKSTNGIVISEKLNISTFKANKIHGYYGYQTINNKYLRLIENPVEGRRIFSEFSLSKYAHINGFNISSNIGLKSINYDLSDNVQNAKNINVPNALLDISTIFIKNDGNNKYLVEPKLALGYSAYENQQNNPIFDSDVISSNNDLFNNDRFSGMDRIGDQRFYTLSMRYKKMSLGHEKISLNLSKKYYTKDRKVWMPHTNNSIEAMNAKEGPMFIVASWMPNKKTSIMGYGEYFKKNKKVPLGGITLNHKFNSGSVSFAKRYRRMAGDFNDQMDYTEVFADIDLNPNFKLIAKLKRDNENNKNVESLVGIEYENCCVALRITGTDRNLSRYILNQEILYLHLGDAWDNVIDIENKSRINFEFELKGLNSSFDKVNKLINNSLFNY